MARIQILELPMEHHGDDTTTPFVLIIDQYEEPQRFVTADEADTLNANWQRIAEQTGARAVLAFPFQVDIPANTVTIDPDGVPIRMHFEGDFTKLYEQADQVAADLAKRFRLGTAAR